MAAYWLVKSEPEVYSIDHLAAEAEQRAHWEGVRNYQARNFMRDEMKLGDGVLFYHSNTKPPGVVGTATVVRESYPDHTQFDSNSRYYDPKATPESPRWFMVDLAFAEKFPRLLSLDEMREMPGLENLPLVRRGNRLSVMPVSPAEWKAILRAARG